MVLDTSEAVRVFSGLAHGRRIEIFRYLVQAGYEGTSPGSIQKQFSLSPSTLSFHLKSLKEIHLIDVRRVGRTLIYSVNFQLMNAAIGYLLENCCLGKRSQTAGSDKSEL